MAGSLDEDARRLINRKQMAGSLDGATDRTESSTDGTESNRIPCPRK
jgi:hypothetical protein